MDAKIEEDRESDTNTVLICSTFTKLKLKRNS